MSSFEKVPVQLWMLVPREERLRLAEVFELGKTGITEVRDQEVVTDGYNADDLSVITAERMASYVGSEESFPRLWELTVAKAKHEVHPPVGKLESEGGGLVIRDIESQEETLQQYEKTDVVLEKVSDASSDNFEPTLEVDKSQDAEVLAKENVHANKPKTAKKK